MQVHKNQYTRDIHANELLALKKVAGAMGIGFSIGLHLEDIGLIRYENRRPVLTDAGNRAIRSRKVTIRRS